MIRSVTYKILKYSACAVVVLYLISRFIVPVPEFNAPSSTVLFAENGNMIGARIASDEQWRFPEIEELNDKAVKCLLEYEDQYFYYHPGVNPISIIRAFWVNVRNKRIRQGGSTLSMQLARLWFKNRKRSYTQKLLEIMLALHFEVNYSKDKIIKLYMSYAPYGGNVVGYETASWRYYGRGLDDLSWAEHAALAVLPNAPAVIYPGKSSEAFRIKRDRLLDRLYEKGLFDETTLTLSKLEQLPGKPVDLPNFANHLLDRAAQQYDGKPVQSYIDYSLQKNAQEIINRYIANYSLNEIHNGSAIIIETATGRILSYIGNSNLTTEHNNHVDVIKAPRSTGSVLKPFLYNSMLSRGEIYPDELVADIPTYISGYAPKNYYENFDGAVHINEALTRSLNIPFVRLLQKFGVDRFYNDLTSMGLSSLTNDSGHYGLSLILGGAEASLLELTNLYAAMARIVLKAAKYEPHDNELFISPYFTEEPELIKYSGNALNPASIYTTLKTLQEVNRPISHDGWRSFSSSRTVSWKTGTSFGNKDAWAIGTTPEYTIGVWIGNADGEGRAGLTGLHSAAPVLFELFQLLPQTSDFQEPVNLFREVELCKQSGMQAGANCEDTEHVFLPDVHYHSGSCQYHRLVHLSRDRKYQVHKSCASDQDMVTESWFVLPAIQELYYKRKSTSYSSLPPFRKDCQNMEEEPMAFIYPKVDHKIFIPKGNKEDAGKVVFEVAHRQSGTKVFWHLDDQYLGSTVHKHQMAFESKKGDHSIYVTDELGNSVMRNFEVLNE